MSRFLLLNFEDFGLNQDITKTIQPNTPVCICCLEKQSPFINLLTCAHSDYLNYFIKPPELKPHNQVVCYECHAILIKIKQFKLQVENSFKILMGETTNDQQLTKKQTKILSYHKAADVLLPKQFTYCTVDKDNETPKNVTINEDINMKNIKIGLDIINKNNQNSSMIGVLAQGLQTLKTIGLDRLKQPPTTLEYKENEETETKSVIKEEMETIGIETIEQLPTTSEDKCKEDIETKSVLNEEMETIHIDRLKPTTNLKDKCSKEDEETETKSVIKEEIDDEIEINEEIPECNEIGNLSTIKEEEETDIEFPVNSVTEQSQTPEHEKFYRQMRITYEDLLKERSLIAQSKVYKNMAYKCENCLIGFKFKENYEDHVKRKHEHQDGSIKCEVCHQELPSRATHNMHMCRHYTRFECISCHEMFNESNDAVYHYKKEHTVNEVKHKCRHCSFTTDVLNKLKLHSLKNHKMVTCKICGQSCSNSSSLAIHVAKAHKSKNKHIHQCKLCPQSFPTKLEYQQHESIQHIMKYIMESEYNTFICSFCHRIYKFKINLVKHLQIHLRKERKSPSF